MADAPKDPGQIDLELLEAARLAAEKCAALDPLKNDFLPDESTMEKAVQKVIARHPVCAEAAAKEAEHERFHHGLPENLRSVQDNLGPNLETRLTTQKTK